MNSIKIILSDLDGVIRHWNSHLLHQKEVSLGLEIGYLYSICFEDNLLAQVLTGKISDVKWRDIVQTRLSNSLGELVSKELVVTWTNSKVTIDKKILEIYKAHFPRAKVFLATNATTRLNEDLSSQNLDGMIDGIFNSSELGVVKPSHAFFKEVLNRLHVGCEDLIYIDDTEINVQAAQQMNIRSHHYQNHKHLIEFLEETQKRNQ